MYQEILDYTFEGFDEDFSVVREVTVSAWTQDEAESIMVMNGWGIYQLKSVNKVK